MRPTVEKSEAYQQFLLIANGPALFNAVVAGCELDLFASLSRKPDVTADELRDHLGIPGHQLRVLLLTLCAAGLVQRADGRYRNAELAEQLLASDRPDSWRHIFVSRHRTDYAGLARATEALRAGTNSGLAVHHGGSDTLYERLADDPELEAALHSGMTAFALQTLPALLDHPEMASVNHLLDVGGGTGTVSTRFAYRRPDARATVFDLPSVARLGERQLPAELAGRVSFVGGDLFTDAYPTGADTILISHVLDVFDEPTIVALLRKAFEALPPAGRLLVYSFNADADETGGILAAQLSFYLSVLATGVGMAYPVGDYERWLRRAGFDEVRVHDGFPLEHHLIVAVKR